MTISEVSIPNNTLYKKVRYKIIRIKPPTTFLADILKITSVEFHEIYRILVKWIYARIYMI